MIVIPVILVIGIALVAYQTIRRPSLAHHGDSSHASGDNTRPGTTVGWASLWTLGVAVLAQMATATLVIWGGAPFGAIACALALVAMLRFHDRGLLLWLPVVAGLFLVAFPFLMWLGG